MNGNHTPYHYISPQSAPQFGTTMQFPTYQQQYNHRANHGRHSSTQPYAPTPQPAGYGNLPSPPRTNSSHSHYGPGLVQPEQPPSRRVSFQSDRSSPNPLPAPQPRSDINLQSQIHHDFLAPPPNNFIYPFTGPSPYGQSTSYLAMAPPDQPIYPNPPNNDPSFPKSRPSVQVKRKRVRGSSSPDPQPNQKRKSISSSSQQPVASSSRVTLDAPSPRTTRKKRDKHQTPVSTLG